MTPVVIDEEQFRADVRAFLEATLPRKGTPAGSDPTASGVSRARDFQARLAAAGLAGLTWPEEYGGRGLPGRFQQLFDREAAAFQLPPRALEIGLGMCGPTLLVHASETQKRAYLPPLLRGEHVWCELFSEPGAGSDLASVQTRALADGDCWVLDGQKVWTSGAQHSDFAACLARTDPDRPKRQGITMLIVDMGTPGITVRPLRQMTGDAHFNEVFLDGVRVPQANAVGETHGGWRVARTMLAFERKALGGMGSGGGGRGGFASLVAEARSRGLDARPEVRQHLADLRIRQTALRNLAAYQSARRAVDRSSAGEASLLKLAMARFVQDSGEATVDLTGPASVAWDPAEPGGGRPCTQLLSAQSASIGGGTNEIVRNVIAEQVLGLPRDEEGDIVVPFRDPRQVDHTEVHHADPNGPDMNGAAPNPTDRGHRGG
jgi:alkylation response protein AidB-like acyl-CoA dehydrogenase